jgi:hypothetical protein
LVTCASFTRWHSWDSGVNLTGIHWLQPLAAGHSAQGIS